MQTNRLRRWYRPGLLCIGDAAHAMSPIGGVGINLAIQDAVVAANVLGAAYRAGPLRLGHLAAVQWRRTWPTRVIQGMQIILQQRLATPALAGQMLPTSVPLVRLPVLRALFPRLIARLIAFGVWPVHVQR